MSGGKGPTKPPPKSRIGLSEVERAMSVLEGRHPDHAKIERQTREAIERRRGEIAIELGRKSRARLARRAAVAAAALAAAGAGVFAWRVFWRTRALEAAIDAAEAPWIARGFTGVASNGLTGARSLEADLSGGGCFVATTTVDAPLRATADGAIVEGPRSVAWCACGPGHVRLEAPPSSGPVGLALLRIDAAVLGGPLARSWLDFHVGAWGDGGRACADAMLDGWIDGHHAPHAESDASWLESDPVRSGLHRAGLRLVAAVDPAHPFGIVEAPAGDCVLAIARTDDALSLRAPGGGRLVSNARGAVAWCGSKAITLTVWRDGASQVAILAAPAARVGGRQGTRETAEAAGIRLPADATWLNDDDLPWNATTLLAASALSNIETSPLTTDPGPLDGRTVALAAAHGASVVSEPESAVIACDPPLPRLPQGSPEAFDALCAPTAPLTWFDKKDGRAAAARGTLPIWLSPLEGRHEPDAVARIPELLALTRRLAREGFEATSLEGVIELADGVRVVGRAGEDAIVAIGLAPQRPWAFPYSNRSSKDAPWDLGDAPRVLTLKPGETVTLVASPPPSAPMNLRRTVVFRRSVNASL